MAQKPSNTDLSDFPDQPTDLSDFPDQPDEINIDMRSDQSDGRSMSARPTKEELDVRLANLIKKNSRPLSIESTNPNAYAIDQFFSPETLELAGKSLLGYGHGAILDLPRGVWEGVKTVGGLINPYTARETAGRVKEGFMSIPSRLAEAEKTAIADPYTYGRTLGGIFGQPAASAGLAKIPTIAGTAAKIGGSALRYGVIPKYVLGTQIPGAVGATQRYIGNGLYNWGNRVAANKFGESVLSPAAAAFAATPTQRISAQEEAAQREATSEVTDPNEIQSILDNYNKTLNPDLGDPLNPNDKIQAEIAFRNKVRAAAGEPPLTEEEENAIITGQSPPSDFDWWVDKGLRTVPAVAGSLIGGATGFFGAGVGAIPGSMAGGAIGSALGNWAAQTYSGEEFNPYEFGLETGIGALPPIFRGGRMGGQGVKELLKYTAKQAGAGAAQGATISTAATPFRNWAQNGNFGATLDEYLQNAKGGALYGGLTGAAIGAYGGRSSQRPQVLPPEPGFQPRPRPNRPLLQEENPIGNETVINPTPSGPMDPRTPNVAQQPINITDPNIIPPGSKLSNNQMTVSIPNSSAIPYWESKGYVVIPGLPNTMVREDVAPLYGVQPKPAPVEPTTPINTPLPEGRVSSNFETEMRAKTAAMRVEGLDSTEFEAVRNAAVTPDFLRRSADRLELVKQGPEFTFFKKKVDEPEEPWGGFSGGNNPPPGMGVLHAPPDSGGSGPIAPRSPFDPTNRPPVTGEQTGRVADFPPQITHGPEYDRMLQEVRDAENAIREGRMESPITPELQEFKNQEFPTSSETPSGVPPKKGELVPFEPKGLAESFSNDELLQYLNSPSLTSELRTRIENLLRSRGVVPNPDNAPSLGKGGQIYEGWDWPKTEGETPNIRAQSQLDKIGNAREEAKRFINDESGTVDLSKFGPEQLNPSRGSWTPPVRLPTSRPGSRWNGPQEPLEMPTDERGPSGGNTDPTSSLPQTQYGTPELERLLENPNIGPSLRSLVEHELTRRRNSPTPETDVTPSPTALTARGRMEEAEIAEIRAVDNLQQARENAQLWMMEMNNTTIGTPERNHALNALIAANDTVTGLLRTKNETRGETGPTPNVLEGSEFEAITETPDADIGDWEPVTETPLPPRQDITPRSPLSSVSSDVVRPGDHVVVFNQSSGETVRTFPTMEEANYYMERHPNPSSLDWEIQRANSSESNTPSSTTSEALPYPNISNTQLQQIQVDGARTETSLHAAYSRLNYWRDELEEAGRNNNENRQQHSENMVAILNTTVDRLERESNTYISGLSPNANPPEPYPSPSPSGTDESTVADRRRMLEDARSETSLHEANSLFDWWLDELRTIRSTSNPNQAEEHHAAEMITAYGQRIGELNNLRTSGTTSTTTPATNHYTPSAYQQQQLDIARTYTDLDGLYVMLDRWNDRLDDARTNDNRSAEYHAIAMRTAINQRIAEMEGFQTTPQPSTQPSTSSGARSNAPLYTGSTLHGAPVPPANRPQPPSAPTSTPSTTSSFDAVLDRYSIEQEAQTARRAATGVPNPPVRLGLQPEIKLTREQLLTQAQADRAVGGAPGGRVTSESGAITRQKAEEDRRIAEWKAKKARGEDPGPIPRRTSQRRSSWDSWGEQQLSSIPDGPPGTFISEEYSYGGRKHYSIVYRNAAGKPIGMAKVNEYPDGTRKVPTMAVRREDRGAYAIAWKRIGHTLKEMNAIEPDGAISGHTARTLTKLDRAVKKGGGTAIIAGLAATLVSLMKAQENQRKGKRMSTEELLDYFKAVAESSSPD